MKKDKYITKEELRRFLVLLNPLAPHITSEIYENIFGKNILDESWPKSDEKRLQTQKTNIVICINNKKKYVVPCPKGLTKEQLIEYLLLQEDVGKALNELDLSNVYHVPDKMLNIVVKNKEKVLQK